MTTNNDALAQLGRNSLAYAKCYVKLVEALLHEGVPERIARQEAGRAASLAAVVTETHRPGCPFCDEDEEG